ncbi:MAG TPA: hypothetical protein VJT75_14665 [Thermoleophilaceae bacterium]|nr:hypothetical protein [Thermoleophilaceae bacterium]
MESDPLTETIEEIRPTLEPALDPLVQALLTAEPIEDAWQALLQGVLDEA